MSKTAPLVCFGTYDAFAYKQDATFTLTGATAQPFCHLTDLKLHDRADDYKLATFEQDMWILDGSHKFAPAVTTNTRLGLVTTGLSDYLGVFASPPVLTIDFSVIHSMDALVLYFDHLTNDYAATFSVKFYNNAYTQISSTNCTATSASYTLTIAYADVRRIVITFNSTNKPFRFLHLLDIDFSAVTYFSNDEIKSAVVNEQIDMTGLTLPINTVDLTLLSNNAQFSILAPAGSYSVLQYHQPLYVYEIVDGAGVFMGKFFLETWKNLSKTTISLNGVDWIGVLDKLEFLGNWYEIPVALSSLLNFIMTPQSVPYSIDAGIVDINMTGWHPVCTCREALQQVLIASRNYATCSRSNVVRIRKSIDLQTLAAWDETITRANFSGLSVELKSQVTGIEVSYHKFVSLATTERQDLYRKTLNAGTYTIIMPRPINDGSLGINNAVITSSGANYINITVASTVEVYITGIYLYDAINQFGQYVPSLPAGTGKNVIKVKDATLITYSNAEDVMGALYIYHTVGRYLQKVKLYAPTAEPGDRVKIDTYSSRQISGVIEKMRIDLARGFTAETQITGKVVPL